jgi:hypothetical protein
MGNLKFDHVNQLLSAYVSLIKLFWLIISVTMADNSNLFKKTQIKQIKKHTKTNFCVRQFPIFFLVVSV